ncbi:coiled-coil domain-containing protein 191 [Anabrus simplex]|uniref:coiled-coil domain-containing protein 191 n=1 Tax=Anabrus simplex TaxID=316456 RepID=UPI0035A3D63A
MRLRTLRRVKMKLKERRFASDEELLAAWDQDSKSKGIHKRNKTDNEFANKKTDLIGRRRLQLSRGRRTGPEDRYRNKDERKLPLVVQNKNTPIHYRFEAQKHIIAKQKEKLQEQGRLIEELKLQHLKRDAEESAKDAKEKINETLANITLRTKDRTVNLQSLIPPIRLVRMTERAKERERRWQLLKEKKQKAEEERLKRIEEEEQRKKQQEEDEKRRKIEELKEKRQREKEMELYKQQEKARIRQLTKKANEYYKRKLLLNFGITPLKRLITLREEQLIVVAAYHKRRLLLRHFYVWKIHVQDILKEKSDKAETCYKMQLLRRSLLALLLVREEYICKEQVADDFYESQLQKRVFIQWQTYTCSQHLQLAIQLERAAAFYNRKIVINSLEQWRRLPTIQKYEREKEERKRLWRQRVQEMLPDFQPVQILEESY